MQVPDSQRAESSRVLELHQGCRILRLQGSMVQKLQSSRNPRLQVSMVSELSNLGIPGFQSRNPLLAPPLTVNSSRLVSDPKLCGSYPSQGI